jgi:glycosyltransferase involved in cell wall biosynthesis
MADWRRGIANIRSRVNGFRRRRRIGYPGMMKLSIVTVTYNAAATVADTLASVAAQQGAQIEHLIIDGGSTDGTVDIVRSGAYPGLRLISEPDEGLYDAMNKGLRAATGDAVGFLNADDFYCRTDAARIILSGFETGGVDAVSASLVIVDPTRTRRVLRTYGALHFRPWMFAFAHMPPHPGFYTRLGAARQVGDFNMRYRIAADFDWLQRAYLDRNLRVLTRPDTIIAMRQGGVSQRGGAARRLLNREAREAYTSGGRRMMAAAPWLKYVAKASQLITRPRDYPAPQAVRWEPAPQPPPRD